MLGGPRVSCSPVTPLRPDVMTCSACGLTKPTVLFGTRRDGRVAWVCSTCRAAQAVTCRAAQARRRRGPQAERLDSGLLRLHKQDV